MKDGRTILLNMYQEYEKRPRLSFSSKEWTDTFTKLIEIGYLSTSEGYFLLGSSVFCNPRILFVDLFFSTLEGVLLWKNLKYSSVLYDIAICYKLNIGKE